MNPVRRSLVALIASCSASPRARSQAAYMELNPPLPVESPGQDRGARVLLVRLHPLLQPRAEDRHLAEDAAEGRASSAACPRCSTTAGRYDASIFYTFEALGLLDKLHRPLFDAIHRDRLRTDKWPALTAWLREAGRRPEEVRGHGEVLRRAEQDQARDPAHRRLQDRRHAGDGGARPLHRALERGHAQHRQPAGRRGPQEQASSSARRHHRRLLGYRRGAGAALRRRRRRFWG